MDEDIQSQAEYLAKQICKAFEFHDSREWHKSVRAYTAVDRGQFPHRTEEQCRVGAKAHMRSLWAKDALEDRCRVNGEIDYDKLAEIDWSPMRIALRRRADALGIHPRYAEQLTVAWRRHKIGGNYWTPHLKAIKLEVQAAMQNPHYPEKPREGQSGYGELPTRYLLGVELHDTGRWKEAYKTMVPFYKRILQAHSEE